MRLVFLAMTLATVFGFFRCSNAGQNQPSNTLQLGVYEYTANDANGKKVISGRLELTEIKERALKGTWQLNKSGDATNLGPQEGTGKFVGAIEDDRIDLNLNPDMADNNVFLSGKFEKGEFKGTWTYSTFAGPTTKGTFVAKKK